jgi:hypothetical protein
MGWIVAAFCFGLLLGGGFRREVILNGCVMVPGKEKWADYEWRGPMRPYFGFKLKTKDVLVIRLHIGGLCIERQVIVSNENFDRYGRRLLT